nr:unnamed protein product [Callosobruchus chinensis]
MYPIFLGLVNLYAIFVDLRTLMANTAYSLNPEFARVRMCGFFKK